MNKFNILLKIVSAMTLITVLFYLRLIPRTARDLFQTMTYQQLLYSLFIILIISSDIYKTLKSLGYIKTQENYLTTKINQITSSISKYILDSLTVLYDTVLQSLEYVVYKLFGKEFFYYETIRKFLIFANKEKYRKIYGILLISLSYLPRIFFISAIIVDVFMYHRFDYAYRCIPLLLLSLLPRMLIFILTHYFDHFHKNIFEMVHKKRIPGSSEVLYSYKPEFENNPPPSVKDFTDFFNNHVVVFILLEESLTSYETLTRKLKTDVLTLFLACCRLIVYIYVLFYGILL